MTKLALFVRLKAKPGQEQPCRLPGQRTAARQRRVRHHGLVELNFGPSTFGVFDAFADEAGRQAHLNRQIAGP